MKNNIDWVIIRCGYGGNYSSQDDAQWEHNVSSCEKYGIPYGVYLYSYATNEEKAKSEAEHTIRLLKGHEPKMPVFLDLEENRIASLGKAKILSIAKIFCNEITKNGYLYGTYANKNWFANYLTDSWYDKYPKWIAQYNKTVTYKGTYDIWQYSSNGTFDGFNSKFDLNYCYTSFLKGDANGDGKVTSADAREALRVAAKIDNCNATEKHLMDMNNDGRITSADAREILKDAARIKE